MLVHVLDADWVDKAAACSTRVFMRVCACVYVSTKAGPGRAHTCGCKAQVLHKMSHVCLYLGLARTT